MPNVAITLNASAEIAAGRIKMSEVFPEAGNIKAEHRHKVLSLTRMENFSGRKVKYLQIIGLDKRPSEINAAGKVIKDTAFRRENKTFARRITKR